jgi:hypothetical protein
MPAFLLPLLLGLAPVVADMFGSGTKDVVTKVTGIAKEVLGVDSLDAVERAMAADPAKALEFKKALIAAATEEKRLQYEAERSEREAYTAQLQATLTDIQSARAVAMSNSPARWGAILVSIFSIVLAGVVSYMMFFPSPEVSKLTESVTLMLVGAAINWVGTVQNFWLGSSMGSQQKDTALADLKKLIVSKGASS